MKHLSPDEIVDVAEGCADASAAAHAAACGGCRSRADAAAGAIRGRARGRGTGAVAAVLAAPGGTHRRRGSPRAGAGVVLARLGWRLAPAAAAAVLVLAVGLALRVAPEVGPPEAFSGLRHHPLRRATTGRAASRGRPSWLLMSLLSAEVSVDEAAASGGWLRPGGPEQALVHLDEASAANSRRS